VEDGRTGYLVAPRDAAQLADAVTRLLLDPSLRRQMGKNGKSKLQAECSSEVIARKTMEVYQRTTPRERPCREEGPTSSSVPANFSIPIRK
jgi:glycosyltransferase involved in cell wall biosynthesis